MTRTLGRVTSGELAKQLPEVTSGKPLEEEPSYIYMNIV
jgi:hypothetical protein